MREELMQIAVSMAEASGGQLRLAENEEDESTDPQPEAAHFLKLNGKRLGRDIELYGFMARVMGEEHALVDFAEHCVLPCAHLPEAYAIAVDGMGKLGEKVFAGKRLDEWKSIFNTSN